MNKNEKALVGKMETTLDELFELVLNCHENVNIDKIFKQELLDKLDILEDIKDKLFGITVANPYPNILRLFKRELNKNPI